MALSRIIDERFGVKTRSRTNPVVDQVEVAAHRILQNNPDRLAYIIVNLGANDVYCAWDKDVSATHGVFLQNGGGILSLNLEDDFELVGYDLFAVAITNPSEIYCIVVEAE